MAAGDGRERLQFNKFCHMACYPPPEKLRIVGMADGYDAVGVLPVISVGLTGYRPVGDMLNKRTWLDG